LNRVFVEDRTGKSGTLADAVKKTLLRCMRRLRIRNADLSLLLTSDREIAALNRQYRKKDRPTDVLSFPQESPRPPRGRLLLGDIAISVPTARRQARQAAHPLRNECDLLAVHGLLHLLGHDHAEPAETAVMAQLQNRLLPGVRRVL
jgi:probable rRNA maturation factor